MRRKGPLQTQGCKLRSKQHASESISYLKTSRNRVDASENGATDRRKDWNTVKGDENGKGVGNGGATDEKELQIQEKDNYVPKGSTDMVGLKHMFKDTTTVAPRLRSMLWRRL